MSFVSIQLQTKKDADNDEASAMPLMILLRVSDVC